MSSQAVALSKPMSEEAPKVIVVNEISKLEALVPDWEQLARAAIEPNVFYEPWMLLPAIRHLAGNARLLFVLIFRPDPSGRDSTLIGFFPLHQTRDCYWVPVSTVSLWRHPYCFLCAPLLHRDHAAEAVETFLDWFRQGQTHCSLLNFGQIPGDGPIPVLLDDWLARTEAAWSLAREFPRGVYAPESAPASSATSTKRRQEFRRRERRLNEVGPLRFATPETGGEIDEWIDRFLALERSGWKGAKGTALACNGNDEKFFRAATRLGQDRVVRLGLYLGDLPLALAAIFASQDAAFGFKLAFNEEYAKYSPGALLLRENSQALAACRLRWIDSCAAPGQALPWPPNRKRLIRDMVISSGSLVGNLACFCLPALRWYGRSIIRRRATVPALISLSLAAGAAVA
jgi:hypothetical protein